MTQFCAETKRREIVERAEALLHDVRMKSVRDWKSAHPGRLAIGHMPVWAPRELVHACGALPVSIFGGGDDVEIIKGDAYFQSYICHLPRSTIEMGLDGSFDCLDGMIFPSICDVIRNLSGMWQILFPDRGAWYLDLPQSFDDIGADFFFGELARIRDEMAERTGHRPSDEDLARSIAVFDDNRRLVAELYQRRRVEPWTYPTSEVYLILRAGCLLEVEEHNRLLTEYLDLASRCDARPLDYARVVLAGSFCEQPPLGLIRTIERAGCYVVDDDLVLGSRLLTREVGSDGSPLRALVRAFVDGAREAAFLYREADKGKDLVERARAGNAEGVLFCAPSFCDPALLDQPMLVAAVEEAGLPWTAFKYAENTGQFQVIREQAGTFADSIKLWSVA